MADTTCQITKKSIFINQLGMAIVQLAKLIKYKVAKYLLDFQNILSKFAKYSLK
jgi:hypothetical protein